MRFTEHSLADLERRYLHCYGVLTHKDQEFFVQINDFDHNLGQVHVKLHGFDRTVSIPCDNNNYDYTFNLPKAQWICIPTDGPHYIARAPAVQFRRGIHVDTIGLVRKALRGWLNVTISLEIAYYINFANRFSNVDTILTNHTHPSAKGFLLSKHIAVIPKLMRPGVYDIYAGLTNVGSAAWNEDLGKYDMSVDGVFQEEINDCLKNPTLGSLININPNKVDEPDPAMLYANQVIAGAGPAMVPRRHLADFNFVRID